MLKSGLHRELRAGLVRTLQKLVAEQQEPSSVTSANRGLRDFVKFGDVLGAQLLPASPVDVGLYIAYSLTVRPEPLDSTSIQTYLGGVSAWHEQAREATGLPLVNPIKTRMVRSIISVALKRYKKRSKAKLPFSLAQWSGIMQRGFKATASGDHQRLFLCFATLGPLRPSACSRICVKYRVSRQGQLIFRNSSQLKIITNDPSWEHPYISAEVFTDKNLDARKTRTVVIPHSALGIKPVKMLRDYLLQHRPPSGGFLFAAPQGRFFRSTRYSNFSNALRKAYSTAFPDASDIKKYAGGTPRKTLSQLIWDAGYSKRILADVGGWALRTDAVDIYFKTQGHQILHLLHGLGRRLQRKGHAPRT
jgi:hypothetical protein